MQLKPLPNYFIIKIDIKKQEERKEKIGSLYLHFNETHMQRNLQHGEIVAIGSMAAKQFPQASIGDILIIHHFVESSEKEKSNFIYSDKTYNYYNVTASVYNGHRNESYAIFQQGKIIPHPDFVFIEPEIKASEIPVDEFIELNTKQVGSLILFNNWEETRESKESKSKEIMGEIKNMSKGKNLRDDVKRGLEAKQHEAETITASLNKKQYKKYKVVYANPALRIIENIFCLSIGAQTEVEFMDKKYNVVQTKYCAATAN